MSDMEQTETDKPPKPAAIGELPLSSKLKLNSGAWNCDICYASSSADVISCGACCTTRPGVPTTDPAPSSSIVEGTLAVLVPGGAGLLYGTKHTERARAQFPFDLDDGAKGPRTASSPSAVSSTTGIASGLELGLVRTIIVMPPPKRVLNSHHDSSGHYYGDAYHNTIKATVLKSNCLHKYEAAGTGYEDASENHACCGTTINCDCPDAGDASGHPAEEITAGMLQWRHDGW